MMEWFDNIRTFFRENPRAWIVLAFALVIAGGVVWTVYGGFSIGLNRFFAQQDSSPCGDGTCDSDETTESCPADCGGGGGDGGGAPTAAISVTPSSINSGGTVNVSWSSTKATSCTTTAGTFSTGGQPNGSATDTISPSFTGTAQFRIRCTGAGGSIDSNVVSVTVTAGGPGPGPGPGPGGPVDPSGKCVFRSQFNAPDGAWFCESLQCNLAGNPPFEPTSARKPPEGPAVRLAVNVMGVGPPIGRPQEGPADLRTKLDSTPKCGNGKECFPPKDPLWSCTQENGKEVDLGRNGHDFYDCYNPIIHRHDYGKITCCANTGLNGDCFTWDLANPAGPGSSTSPAPTSSVAPSSSVAPTGSVAPSTSPTGSVAPGAAVSCAPVNQTVQVGQVARLTAAGGNNAYTWNITQGGQLESGGNEYIGVKYSVSGSKTLRVNSAGRSAACTVEVVTTGPTTSPTQSTGPTQSGGPYPTGGPTDGPLAIQKTARNMTYGDPVGKSAVTVYPGQTVQFRINLANKTATSFENVKLKDVLPNGMSYKNGSTLVDARAVAAESVTTSGLSIGRLEPARTITVEWSAVADRTFEIVSGPNQSSPTARVTANGLSDVLAAMSVTVYGSGTGESGGGAGGIPTGPGDAVLVALMTAAVLTLLYGGYTRSSLFRRHEAETVSRERDPLDFRS